MDYPETPTKRPPLEFLHDTGVALKSVGAVPQTWSAWVGGLTRAQLGALATETENLLAAGTYTTAQARAIGRVLVQHPAAGAPGAATPARRLSQVIRLYEQRQPKETPTP